MSKRTGTFDSEELDEYGHPVDRHDGIPEPDKRALEQKYKALSEDLVELRVRFTAQGIQLADAFKRIRALEACSVLDLIPE